MEHVVSCLRPPLRWKQARESPMLNLIHVNFESVSWLLLKCIPIEKYESDYMQCNDPNKKLPNETIIVHIYYIMLKASHIYNLKHVMIQMQSNTNANCKTLKKSTGKQVKVYSKIWIRSIPFHTHDSDSVTTVRCWQSLFPAPPTLTLVTIHNPSPDLSTTLICTIQRSQWHMYRRIAIGSGLHLRHYKTALLANSYSSNRRVVYTRAVIPKGCLSYLNKHMKISP